MSKIERVNIDFSRFSNQGAYFSSYTPLRVQQYMRSPFIPQRSAYHLISCIHPSVMARSNVPLILSTYINASERCRSHTIIDLCMPYYDNFSKRTFLGRYIIFKGQLVCIRLSTNVKRFGPQFSAWPRHKSQSIAVKSTAKPYSIMVGQVAIYLPNLRIGLLFQSQLQTSTQEYLNCGFEIIALAYEGHRLGGVLIGLKEDLCRSVLLLVGGVGEEQQEQAKQMMSGNDTQSRRSKIYMSYYSFQKIYARKQDCFMSQKETNLIKPVQIDLVLTQPRENLPPITSLYYEIIHQSYSIHPKIPFSSFSDYLYRLSILHRRSGGKKIVVMLEDSPQIICFLYLLEQILNQFEQTTFFRHIFKFIDLSNTRLSTILSRFAQLRFQTGQNNQSSKDITTKLIKCLDYLTESETQQHFFPIITAHQQTINVLRMLNDRQRLRIEEGENDCLTHHNTKPVKSNMDDDVSQVVPQCKTWIGTGFFGEEELRQLYFSDWVRQVVADHEWHQEIWKKYERMSRRQQSHQQKDVVDIEELCLTDSVKPQDLVQKDCPFMHQFQAHYAKTKEKGNINRKVAFAHFFFRKLTYIQAIGQPSLLQELLNTSELNILSTYRFLYNRPVLLTRRLTHQITLNFLALAREQAQAKSFCRCCCGNFDLNLMLRCRVCNQTFCYECLLNSGAYSEESLIQQGQIQPWVKLCLLCLGVPFDKSQYENKQKREGHDGNMNLEECHFCGSSSAFNEFRCSSYQCGLIFCRQCIEEEYHLNTRQYEENDWFCFVCQHKCYCNSCQAEKRLMVTLQTKKFAQISSVQTDSEPKVRRKVKMVRAKDKDRLRSERSETQLSRPSMSLSKCASLQEGSEAQPIQL